MDAVEEIRARLNIEDVISEYVQLKRAGRNWKGLSPFGNEKTPSFVVSPEKQIWHDFSSGRGGNMFSFVMEMEGLDFKGALELLARKAGVDLEQFRKNVRSGGPNKERLYELLDLSTKFYQTQFSQNEIAWRYVFEKRQFSKETALAWRLGYAPSSGTALVDFLKKRGFTDVEMKQAGVVAQRYRGAADMFRGRLMVPLRDATGRVIGYTARILVDDPNAPKYINTPSTVLYDKSRHVFGLDLAKEAIRKEKFVVAVEGNLDVIASWQAGVKQTVAIAGTALTEYHLKTLSRFTPDIRLCFDADKAGVAATERAIPLASRVGVSLSVIDIPSGKDPDELVRQDPKLWQETINNHQYALDWLMARYQKLLDVDSAQGKKEFTSVLLPLVRRLTDQVEQDHYLTKIADITGVGRQALDAKMAGAPSEPLKKMRNAARQPLVLDKQTIEYAKAQDHILALALMHPGLRAQLDVLTPDMFAQVNARELLGFIKTHPDFDGSKESIAKLAEIAKVLEAPSKGLHSSAMLGADEQQTESYDGTAKDVAESATSRSLSREDSTWGEAPQRAETRDRVTSSARQDGGGVQSFGDYVKILILQHEQLYQDLDETELAYEASRLTSKLVETYVKLQKQTLAAQLSSASDADTATLLERVRALDTLLNQVKGD